MTNLKESIVWYTELQDDKRNFILNCLKNDYSVRLSNFLFNEQEVQNYLSLIDNIVELVSKIIDKEKTMKKLIAYGMEEKDAKLFFVKCESFVRTKRDVAIVKNMNAKSFKCALDFVINKMCLLEEYRYYSPAYVMNYCSFQNSQEMAKTLRFLYFAVSVISKRSFSLPVFETVLKNDYCIPDELVNIFITSVEKQLSGLKEAQMYFKINEVFKRVEYIERYLTLDEDDNEDEEDEEDEEDV